jgi:ABC transporter
MNHVCIADVIINVHCHCVRTWCKQQTVERGWGVEALCLQARYRPGLPLVLRGLSFRIPSGTVCGVVGRTGSGKSSLLLALFNLIDIDGGRIVLDGVDVARVPLRQLRRQIAIIPQDPLLFSGVPLTEPGHIFYGILGWCQARESVCFRHAHARLAGVYAQTCTACMCAVPLLHHQSSYPVGIRHASVTQICTQLVGTRQGQSK